MKVDDISVAIMVYIYILRQTSNVKKHSLRQNREIIRLEIIEK